MSTRCVRRFIIAHIAFIFNCVYIINNGAIFVTALSKPYWFDPRIHMFGNVGIGGRFHSFVAGPVTQWLDYSAYNNIDIRGEKLKQMRPGTHLCDLGCGVGRSTYRSELMGKFQRIVGVDTSNAMIDTAKWSLRTRHKDAGCVEFAVDNAETYGRVDEFNTTLVSFVLHEAPPRGRSNIIRNAIRISNEQVVIMDICPTYNPSTPMLLGEPFLLNYLEQIDRDISAVALSENWKIARSAPVIGRMVTWTLAPLVQGTDEDK